MTHYRYLIIGGGMTAHAAVSVATATKIPQFPDLQTREAVTRVWVANDGQGTASQ